LLSSIDSNGKHVEFDILKKQLIKWGENLELAASQSHNVIAKRMLRIFKQNDTILIHG